MRISKQSPLKDKFFGLPSTFDTHLLKAGLNEKFGHLSFHKDFWDCLYLGYCFVLPSLELII